MSTPRGINKFGPVLAAEMCLPCPAGQTGEPLDVVVMGSRSAVRALRTHHDTSSLCEELGYVSLSLSRQELLRLVGDRGVLLVERDVNCGTLPDPLQDFGPGNNQIFERYKHGRLAGLDGSGIRVLIADTGFSPHPDIPVGVHVIDCTEEGTTRDWHGHGTAIVSQLVATGPHPGLVKLADVSVARIFDRRGTTTTSRIMKACSFAMRTNVHVMSNSWGGAVPNPVIQMALQRLNQAGIVVIASAGNAGPENGTVGYPAGFPDVLAVGAVDKSGRLASFSSRGVPNGSPAKPDIVAEGVGITMARSVDGSMGEPVGPHHCRASGTSFSAPIVSCLAVMVVESHRGQIAPGEVKRILQDSARR